MPCETDILTTFLPKEWRKKMSLATGRAVWCLARSARLGSGISRPCGLKLWYAHHSQTASDPSELFRVTDKSVQARSLKAKSRCHRCLGRMLCCSLRPAPHIHHLGPGGGLGHSPRAGQRRGELLRSTPSNLSRSCKIDIFGGFSSLEFTSAGGGFGGRPGSAEQRVRG